MKILFVSANYPPQAKGGGELSTHYIAQGLIGRGHQVRVVTSGDREEEYEVQGVPVKKLPVKINAKPLLEKKHSKKVAKVLESYIKSVGDFDVIHAHDFRSALALSEIISDNMIVTVRDYAQICGSPNNLLADGTICPGCNSLPVAMKNEAVARASMVRKPFRVWQYWWNVEYRKEAFRKFKRHIYISHAQMEQTRLQQDLSGIKTRVIYNPVPSEYLKEPRVNTLNETILYVGTLGSYKGVGLLLEAFHDVSKEFPNAFLKIVGEGEQKKSFEQFVARNGLQYKVEFAGRIDFDMMRHVYDQTSIVVAPHLWIEPFGRTVVEGMSRGKIVISANAGGPGEIIEDSVTGLLFKKASKNDLVSALSRALEMKDLERREIGQVARVWVANNINQNEIARQYELAY